MEEDYDKVRKARQTLLPLGDINEKECAEVVALTAQAEAQRSILLELKVIHILFHRPIKE